MKMALPENAKIAKEAKECMQECVSEFISFITSEGSQLDPFLSNLDPQTNAFGPDPQQLPRNVSKRNAKLSTARISSLL